VIEINRDQENREPVDIEENNKQNFRKMLVFCCSCGVKILIVPDLDAMSKAINNHMSEHKKLTRQRLTEEILTQEILKVISEVYL
jgi:hypothetical protein